MFKVGDIVRIDKNIVMRINGYIPNWFIEKKFIIKKIKPAFDDDGYPLVELNEDLINVRINKRSISSQYLKKTIKEDRKNKLNKIKIYEKI